MTKVSALVREALFAAGVIGIGQNANAEDSNRGLTQLNYLLADWRTKRLILYRDKTISFSAPGTQIYTIGPTGFTVIPVRPNQIKSAFRRQSTGAQDVDTPLTVIKSIIDYNAITLKTLSPVPTHIFYDPTFPNGSIYIWPVPSSLYAIHVTFSDEIAAFANLAANISLPPEYEAALHWNLTEKLRTVYRKPMDPMISKEAKSSRRTLRNSNLDIPKLRMPSGLAGVSRGAYNVYSDT